MPTPPAEPHDEDADDIGHAFPDFCRGEALLSIVVAMQLVAICLTLASSRGDAAMLPRLGLLSLYLQWIGICGAATLCALRQRLEPRHPRALFGASWAALVVVVGLLSDAAWRVNDARDWQLIAAEEGELQFVLRNACLAAIVALLLLRYFWTRQQWRAQVQAQSEARFQALTARIRPHFLFNALNSLASLIASRPAAAEGLVEDLADVLRASFDDPRRRVPLRAELDACRAYLRIEQLRLGDRLRLDWQVPDALLDIPVPRFTLQPLVENAIYHGISRRPGGGTLSLHARQHGERLRLEVVNPLAEEPTVGGQGMAIHNIRRRLALMYGGQASLSLTAHADRYSAALDVPAR